MNKGRKDRGYPRTKERSFAPAYIFPQCGGKGGVVCPELLTGSWTYFTYEVSRFTVYNRKLILNNNFGTGIDPYTSGTPIDPCTYGLGTQMGWFLAFGVDGNLTEEEILAQNMRFIDNVGDEIEVLGDRLPQPTDANWDGKIFIYIYWGNQPRVNYGNPPILEVVKYDGDIKV